MSNGHNLISIQNLFNKLNCNSDIVFFFISFKIGSETEPTLLKWKQKENIEEIDELPDRRNITSSMTHLNDSIYTKFI